MKHKSLFICFFLFQLLWSSCAIQVPPGGGDKDISEPKVIRSVPENFSTEFKGNEIAITFNEYIQLKDVQTKLVVSPPLNIFPDLKVRKKTLHISFEDTLENNTTYSFNFGNSITDNNEGNAIENYQFVFSTGNVIDSLEISGEIKNSFDAKPVKEALVMLYKENVDSLPYKRRPYYFGKSDVEGHYRVRNISPGSYKVIGLKDGNQDYLYNPFEEDFAFSDSIVEAGASGIDLRLFKETEPLKIIRTYSEEPGKAICIFSGRADTVSMIWYSDTVRLDVFNINYSEKKDTLTIWYRNLDSDTLQIGFPQIERSDTVIVRLLKKDSKIFSKSKPVLRIEAQNSAGKFQDLHRPFDILFNHPVETANLNAMEFLEDSVKISGNNFQFIDSAKKILRYNGKWKPSATCDLLIPSGLFRDIYKLENDTLITEFRTKQETDYASLTGALELKSNKYPVLIQLVDANEKVFEERVLQTDTAVVFNYLAPGLYRLKLIIDKNKNSQWDPGIYLSKIQPEEIFYYPEPIQIRSNWDVEIKWIIP